MTDGWEILQAPDKVSGTIIEGIFNDQVRKGRYVPLTESQKMDFVKKFDQYLNSSWNRYRLN